ncbi:SDR family NAD(P)-dependent oxidoreductase [Nonomuraea muscovyensis]|uniref:SDR family NAD(P)-dependent oxidoreductase n=1 Tax=Nonomuraea muscovyensis TaxID=1124761 RepID=UPI0033DE570E
MTAWTLAGMPDLTGRTAIVTGADSGIGLPTALELARHGARVVVTARSAEKGAGAVSGIRQAVPDARVAYARLDLADLASVREFAAGIDQVDLLVDNAGVAMTPKSLTKDGFELQFGTNHLGHFALRPAAAPVAGAAGRGRGRGLQRRPRARRHRLEDAGRGPLASVMGVCPVRECPARG